MAKISIDAKRQIKTLKSAGRRLESEIRKNTLTAILAAFGFIIALVWRDAIQSGVSEIVNRMGIAGTGYIYQITIATAVTVICVVGIIAVSKLKGKEDVKE